MVQRYLRLQALLWAAAWADRWADTVNNFKALGILGEINRVLPTKLFSRICPGAESSVERNGLR